jgi:hypothetical protein
MRPVARMAMLIALSEAPIAVFTVWGRTEKWEVQMMTIDVDSRTCVWTLWGLAFTGVGVGVLWVGVGVEASV